MSEIKAMTTILRRMFSRRAPNWNTPLAGVRKRMQLMDQDESVDSFDNEDISEFETDFMNIGTSHKIHERYIYIFYSYIKILFILSLLKIIYIFLQFNLALPNLTFITFNSVLTRCYFLFVENCKDVIYKIFVNLLLMIFLT